MQNVNEMQQKSCQIQDLGLKYYLRILIYNLVLNEKVWWDFLIKNFDLNFHVEKEWVYNKNSDLILFL